MRGTIDFISSLCAEAAGSLINPSKKTGLPELEALGSSLREARESRGLSRDALAERLRMGVQQLEAIETGDRDRLHEPVFVIAQARRIAAVLEVNVDAPIEALRRSRAFRRTPSKPLNELEPGAAAPAAPSRRIWRPVPAVLVSLAVVVAALTALIHSGRLPSGAFRQGGVAPKAAGTSAPADTAAAPAQPSSSSEVASPEVASPEPLKPKPDTLELSAKGPSWLEVTTDDGTSLFHGLFRGRKSFPLGRGLRVLAGRPDLVMVQIGAAAPRPLGPVNDVNWQRFEPASAAPAP